MKLVKRISMWKSRGVPGWKESVIDSLLAIGGVALVTSLIGVTQLYPRVPAISFLYLLVVLALASTRGLYSALLASVLSLLAFDFFFFPPAHTLFIGEAEDLLTLCAFLATSVVASQLASALRRRAEQARSRERELRLLYYQAQELAALQERQRLARELHDSVSQVLYGISLGAHTAKEALQDDPEQVATSLEYVLALSEAGLAEMRALIFELRPESLESEGLVAALNRQLAVLSTRHKLHVNTEIGEEPALSLETKHALYRIAQEALHNIVKHAHAQSVELRLAQKEDTLLLEVSDDGKGFDADQAFPGHLGLRSMQERAAKVGATLTIKSMPGQGTGVSIQTPLALEHQ